MSKKLKKSLSWLLTFCMLISLFCGMVPSASAKSSETLYTNSELGISINAESAAVIKKTGTFKIMVDGVVVLENKTVSLGASNTITINAPEYLVKFSDETNCDVAGTITPYTLTAGVGDTFSVTIELEKTYRDIPIVDEEKTVDYGTFSWSKNHASTTDYQRTLTVYVDDQYAYSQQVQTPETLVSGEYWFTPNSILFHQDYKLEPVSLDIAANKDIRVYLTSVCGCGRDTCLCEGSCDCPKDCECDLCMGTTLAENQFNTGFGILEYKEPSAAGYQLTVEVYVNGTKMYTKEDLRVRAGENDCLNFTPANGYYYFTENGYDLDAVYDQASWVQSTGYLYLGVLNQDREGPNVLKIYLWTWQENQDIRLDLWREAGVSKEDVTGCLISFEAINPKTNQMQTYTYQATKLDDGAQPQHVPLNTTVTLTAICKDGQEVTQWRSPEGYLNARFEGILGGDGDNLAYGNSAYLTMTQASEAAVSVWIGKTQAVQAPTDECLKKLLDDQITVTCTNEDADHDSIPYKLDLNSVTRPTAGVTGNALNHYAYTIKISSDSYVDQYDIATGKTHTPASATEEVTLEYNGKDWTVKDGDSPVNFNVKCETTTPPVTEKTIYVSFLNSDNTNPVKYVPIKSSDAALTAPTADDLATVAGKEFKGWKVQGADAIYTGTYTFEALAQIVDANDNWSYDKTEGYVTFVPVFEDKEEPTPETEYVVHFYIANEEGGSYMVNGESVKTVDLTAVYDEARGTYMVKFPTLKLNSDYEITGWQVDGQYTAIWHKDSSEAIGIEGLVNADNQMAITPILKYTGGEPEPETEYIVHFYIANEEGGSYRVNGRYVKAVNLVAEYDEDLGTYVVQFPTLKVNKDYELTGWKVSGRYTAIWHEDSSEVRGVEGLVNANNYLTITPIFAYTGDDHPTVETRYTIEATAHKGGEISPDGIYKVYKYSDKTYTITADKGYKIYDVVVDGVSVGAVHTYTFERVTEDHTIEVYFAKLPTDPDDSGTSNWLETKDHVAYMTGYPDGTFGPNRNMTRAEVAQMFYALLLNKNVTTTVAFSDVSADAWYAKAVNTLASLGMVSGYPDGTFHPDAPITRAEFATIALAFAYEPLTASCNYNDVPTSAWFYTYVAQATTYGWIGGSNGYFRPNDNITRAEVSVIVNNMLGRAADEDYVDAHAGDLVTFPDVRSSFWAYYSIMETVNDHEYVKLNGLEDWK